MVSQHKTTTSAVVRPAMGSVWLDDDDESSRSSHRQSLKHSMSLSHVKNQEKLLKQKSSFNFMLKKKKSGNIHIKTVAPKFPISTPFNFNHVAHLDEQSSFGINEAFNLSTLPLPEISPVSRSESISSSSETSFRMSTTTISSTSTSCDTTHSRNYSNNQRYTSSITSSTHSHSQSRSLSNSKSLSHLTGSPRSASFNASNAPPLPKHSRDSFSAYTTQPLASRNSSGTSLGDLEKQHLKSMKSKPSFLSRNGSISETHAYQFPHNHSRHPSFEQSSSDNYQVLVSSEMIENERVSWNSWPSSEDQDELVDALETAHLADEDDTIVYHSKKSSSSSHRHHHHHSSSSSHKSARQTTLLPSYQSK